MVESFSQNFVKYHGCGVYFTLLLDGKHCGAHHKMFLTSNTTILEKT